MITELNRRAATAPTPTQAWHVPQRIAGAGLILALALPGCDSSRPLADAHSPPTDVVVRSNAAFFATAATPSAAASPATAPATEAPAAPPAAHRGQVLVIRGEDSMDHRTLFSQTLAWGDDMFAVPLHPGSHVVLSAEISGQPTSHVDLGEVVVPEQPGHEIDVTLDRHGGRVTIAQLSRPHDPEIADPPNPLLTPFDVPTVLPPPLPPVH